MDAQAVGTLIAGAGLFLLAGSTWLQYRETRKNRHMAEYQIGADLTQRVDMLMPELSSMLDLPEDDIDARQRPTYVNFYLLYAQAWKAARLGLVRDRDWDGLRSEFAYWAEQPAATEAMRQLRRTQEGWPNGFFDFVAAEVALLREQRWRGQVESSGTSGDQPPRRGIRVFNYSAGLRRFLAR